MIIDLLENFYRKRADSGSRNPFRASRAGHCERALGYDKLGIEGDPITPRRAAVFRHGTILDGALKADLAAVLIRLAEQCRSNRDFQQRSVK